MTDREHGVAADLLIRAEKEGEHARLKAMSYVAGLPRPDVEAIERKVAELKAAGEPKSDA